MSTQQVNFEMLLDLLAEKVAEKLRQPVEQTVQMLDGMPRLLDLKQAGLRLSRSASAVRHMVNNGTIPDACVKRMGRRLFLDAKQLQRWMDAQ